MRANTTVMTMLVMCHTLYTLAAIHFRAESSVTACGSFSPYYTVSCLMVCSQSFLGLLVSIICIGAFNTFTVYLTVVPAMLAPVASELTLLHIQTSWHCGSHIYAAVSFL
jgi:hypothetical protein